MPIFSSQGANALVTYTIISGADDSFRIDPESGDLIATRRLDRERRSKYSLLVRADDGLQSSDMRINITVSDVNDHSPKFSRPVYSFDIPEDTTPGRECALRVFCRDHLWLQLWTVFWLLLISS